jgi:predicted nucleic-acid-binding Zn-ribbon protein
LASDEEIQARYQDYLAQFTKPCPKCKTMMVYEDKIHYWGKSDELYTTVINWCPECKYSETKQLSYSQATNQRRQSLDI